MISLCPYQHLTGWHIKGKGDLCPCAKKCQTYRRATGRVPDRQKCVSNINKHYRAKRRQIS